MSCLSCGRLARMSAVVAGMLVLVGPLRAQEGTEKPLRATMRGAVGPQVHPGELLEFGAADFASSTQTVFGGLDVFVTHPAAPGETDFAGALNFALGGSTLVDGEASTVFQYHQFTVGADAETMGTPVRALVSGRVDVAGLLALLNMGSVNLLVAVDVLDVTADPMNRDPASGQMIASQALFMEAVTGAYGVGLSMGLSVDAGSATAAQVGVSPGVAIELPVQAVRIKKSTGFGVDAVLKRGHTYRVVTYATATMTAGPGGGAGAAVFVDPATFPGFDKNTLPQLLSPVYWLDRVAGDTDLDLALPARELNFSALAEELPEITIPAIRLAWPGFFDTLGGAIEDICKFFLPDEDCPSLSLSGTTTLLDRTPLVDMGDLVSLVFDGVSDVDGDGVKTANDLLGEIGLPTDFNGVVGDFLGVTEQTFGSLGDWIPDGGVKYTDLAVTVMRDEVEILAANHADTVMEIRGAAEALSSQIGAGFASIGVTVETGIAESFRQRIEQNLAGTTTQPIARFMLPERLGGELETVRDIVGETIDAMIAAGEPVFSAPSEYQRGLDAMGAERFKDAYRHFAKAYREATK